MAHRLFTANAASQAIRLARRVCRNGVTSDATGRVRAIGLTWRRLMLGVFSAPLSVVATGMTVHREIRLVLSQRHVETRWVMATGRQGPAGVAGATGRAVPDSAHGLAERTVGTNMIWAIADARMLPRQRGGSTSPAPGAPNQPNTGVAPLQLRFLAMPGWGVPGAGGRSSDRDTKVGPDLLPRLAPWIVRKPSRALTFAAPIRGSDDLTTTTWRKGTGVPAEDKPPMAVSGQSRVASPTVQASAPQMMELVWRKAEPLASVDQVRGGGPAGMKRHQRETVSAEVSNSWHDGALTPTPQAQRSSSTSPAPASPQAPLDAAGLARLADEVIRRIDKRERIARERAGR